MKSVSTENGFTLMEVMVVSAIVGITASLAVPNYLQWNSRYQLKQVVMEIHSQLGVSRLLAMNRNTSVNLAVVVAGSQVSLTLTDATGVQVVSPQTINVSHVTAVGGTTTIQFNSLGLRSSGAAGDQLMTVGNDRGLTYSVRVTQGGKASWCPKATCP